MSVHEDHLQLAASAWALKATSSIEMEPRLAEAFAGILDDVRETLEASHDEEMNAAIKVIHGMMRAEISFNEGERGASLEITKAYRAADKFLEEYYLIKQEMQKCCCVAGLPDPECPQHGVHSLQATGFYDSAYRANIQSRLAQFTGTLHKELLDTGLVTIEQWNDKIAPALVAIDQSVETPREWAERTAPLTPFGEAVWKLSVAILLHLEGLCPALRGKVLVADIYSLLATSPLVQPVPEIHPTANSGGTA